MACGYRIPLGKDLEIPCVSSEMMSYVQSFLKCFLAIYDPNFPISRPIPTAPAIPERRQPIITSLNPTTHFPHLCFILNIDDPLELPLEPEFPVKTDVVLFNALGLAGT